MKDRRDLLVHLPFYCQASLIPCRIFSSAFKSFYKSCTQTSTSSLPMHKPNDSQIRKHFLMCSYCLIPWHYVFGMPWETFLYFKVSFHLFLLLPHHWWQMPQQRSGFPKVAFFSILNNFQSSFKQNSVVAGVNDELLWKGKRELHESIGTDLCYWRHDWTITEEEQAFPNVATSHTVCLWNTNKNLQKKIVQVNIWGFLFLFKPSCNGNWRFL